MKGKPAIVSRQEKNKTTKQQVNNEDKKKKKNALGDVATAIAVFALGILAPWAFNGSYTYLLLQQPDLVNRILGLGLFLRPAKDWTDPRQVLIVGTMGSGTTQVAADLSKLGEELEICHENADATAYFCRDGTVSWFHGWRFLQQQPADGLEAAIEQQCKTYTPNMGMHPSFFWEYTAPTLPCAFQNRFFPAASWETCGMAGACRAWLRRESGCALSKTCVTPFSIVLHQVRHPIRTVESLVAKFCHRGRTIDEQFAKFPAAWFGRPSPQFTDQNSLSSCLWTAGWYVVDYHNAMLRARKEGLIHRTYRIEDTSPCHVAEMAGFWNTGDADEVDEGTDKSAVWPSNRQRVNHTCQDQRNHASMTSTSYRVNRGRVSLGPANFTYDAVLRVLWDELVVLRNGLGYATPKAAAVNANGARKRASDGDL